MFESLLEGFLLKKCFKSRSCPPTSQRPGRCGRHQQASVSTSGGGGGGGGGGSFLSVGCLQAEADSSTHVSTEVVWSCSVGDDMRGA